MTQIAPMTGPDDLITLERPGEDPSVSAARPVGRHPVIELTVHELCQRACELLLEAAELLDAVAGRQVGGRAAAPPTGATEAQVPRLGWFG